VPAEILARLIEGPWPLAGLRRVKQRQPQHMVGWFVPAVLAVVEHGCAERT